MHRIDGLHQLHHVLAHMLVVEDRLVVAVEIRREIDHDTLVAEGLAAIRDALGRTRRTLLLLVEVLERLAVDQVEREELLVQTRRQTARIRYHHFRALETRRVVVDHDVEQFAPGRLVVYVDMKTADVVVELPHGDLQLRALLPQGEDQRPELGLRLGQHVITEEKRPYAEEHHQHCQRTQDAKQRDTRRLHGGQLHFLR